MSGFYKFPIVLMAGMAAGILAAPSGAAAKARCPNIQTEPRITLKTNPGRVVYNNTRNRSQISRLKSKRGGAGKRGWQPIGLTVGNLQFGMEITVHIQSRSKKSYCAKIDEVQANLGFGRITVYVAKRYRKGSCQYRSILNHEREHIEIFRNALAVYAPKVERRLTEVAARLKPVSAFTVKRAVSKLQKTLHREMKPLFKAMNMTIDTNNDRIDTIKNYKREQAHCSAW
jgi:hypothetical protein